MGPLFTAVLGHADQQPHRLAMVFHETHLRYADLAHEIGRRTQELAAADPDALTVDRDADMPDKVLDALARLALGFPIVGATSGSTGHAKSYARAQTSWIRSFESEQACFGINQHDRVMAHGNLSHSLFFYAVCNALYTGAAVSCSRGFRPDTLLSEALDLGATVIYAVPTHLEMILRHSQGITLPNVRLVLSSGARFSKEHAGRIQQVFPNANVIDFYGASETSYIALANHTGDPNLPVGSVGKSFPGVMLAIESEPRPAESQPLPHGMHTGIGRIWVHSEMLFDRYLGASPEVFSERVDPGGRRWVTVGDLGWINAEGYLFLAGRADRTINVSGVKIQPEEIESALLAHPAVTHAAVTSLPDALRGERLVAAIKTNPPVSAAELIAHLRLRIDEHKIPRDYHLLDPWPMTPTGKTDFASVPRLIASSGAEPL